MEDRSAESWTDSRCHETAPAATDYLFACVADYFEEVPAARTGCVAIGATGLGCSRGCGVLPPWRCRTMNDVTRILSDIEHGDPRAAERLLPLVYDELRKLAARRLAREKTGQTLQATALVHEAYLRLVDDDLARPRGARGHFFAAAAEAMRRILIANAHRKRSDRHGGSRRRSTWTR